LPPAPRHKRPTGARDGDPPRARIPHRTRPATCRYTPATRRDTICHFPVPFFVLHGRKYASECVVAPVCGTARDLLS
jgi:hypothetical protein